MIPPTSIATSHDETCCIHKADSSMKQVMIYKELLSNNSEPVFLEMPTSRYIRNEVLDVSIFNYLGHKRAILLSNVNDIVTNEASKLDKRNIAEIKQRGFIIYGDKNERKNFNLTDIDTEVLDSTLKISARYGGDAVRYEGLGSIFLAYCQKSSSCLFIFNDDLHISQKYSDKSYLFVCKFIAAATSILSEKPSENNCIKMTINMNFHLNSQKDRLLWHHDQFKNSDWFRDTEIALLQTHILKSPIQNPMLEIGLMNKASLDTPDSKTLDNFLLEEAKGKAQIDEEGRIIALECSISDSDKNVYLLDKVKEKLDAGYDVLQSMEYSFSGNKYKVVHSSSEFNSEIDCNEIETDDDLQKSLDIEEQIQRKVLVIRTSLI